ncbi:MAG: hypothetical protein M3R00_00155 [Pseudomonadota bacterium]|nr:hypothetical protein [Pseudomonadota bacterium]
MNTTLATNGIADLSHLSTLCIRGDNTKKFLQGQFTCDVNRLNSTQSIIGSYCNIKGRVLSVMHLVEIDDAVLLLMPKDLIPSIAKTLQKYGQFSRVTLDTTQSYTHTYGLIGSAADAFADTQNIELPTAIGAVRSSPNYLIIRYPGSLPRWLCLTNTKLDCVNTADWHAQDIMIGLPQLNPATTEQFTVHMLNLKAFQAVSFTKGCFLGQEIIARTEHLGKAKRGLYWCDVVQQVPITAGTLIYANGNEVGMVINSTSTHVLAVLNHDIDFANPLTIGEILTHKWTPVAS